MKLNPLIKDYRNDVLKTKKITFFIFCMQTQTLNTSSLY